MVSELTARRLLGASKGMSVGGSGVLVGTGGDVGSGVLLGSGTDVEAGGAAVAIGGIVVARCRMPVMRLLNVLFLKPLSLLPSALTIIWVDVS